MGEKKTMDQIFPMDLPSSNDLGEAAENLERQAVEAAEDREVSLAVQLFQAAGLYRIACELHLIWDR